MNSGDLKKAVYSAYRLSSIAGAISRMVGWSSVVKATMFNDDLYGLKKSGTGILHYLFLKSMNAYVAISRDLIDEFKANGFQSNRIYHIPNGVDTDRFRPADKNEKFELREKLDLPLHKIILLSVGVFDNRKNMGWLIKEWNDHNGFDDGSYLLAVGPQSRDDTDGRFIASLREIASKRESNMRILDYVENIEQYYRAADAFVLPSTNEGMPNVILEAMASGLPCLATASSIDKY
jgi:glycosyltransferase involved in cell wall biosynthesis